MKIYLAGPMRGYEEYNFPAFHQAAAELRAEGHEVISPAERDLEDGFDPSGKLEPYMDTRWFMKKDIPLVLECDAIALLPNWEDSIGATIEHFVAMKVGMTIIYRRGSKSPMRGWGFGKTKEMQEA